MTGLNVNPSQDNWAPDPDAQPEPLAPQSSYRRNSATLSRNNLVLAALFIAGVAVIALLHLKAGPQPALAGSAAGDTQMDTLLAELTQVKNDCRSATANAVINRFYCEARQRQVPPEQLLGNPFRMELPEAPPPEAPVKEPSHAAAPNPEAVALAEALENIRGLELQSVLTGSSGATAVVSNNVLTVGQNVGGWTVVEIAPKKVVLEWKSHRHILTMK
jgi:hypothetical protein